MSLPGGNEYAWNGTCPVFASDQDFFLNKERFCFKLSAIYVPVSLFVVFVFISEFSMLRALFLNDAFSA